MNYTPFGEYFKILRIKHKEILADATKYLGVSAAFISSVETGKKPVPANWFEKISNHFNLKEKEKVELLKAIDETKDYIRFDFQDATNVQKQMVIELQRSFKNMDEETINQFMKILEEKKK